MAHRPAGVPVAAARLVVEFLPDLPMSHALILHATEESPAPDGAGRGTFRLPKLTRGVREPGELRPDSIRVRVLTVGVCGTDLHLLETHEDGRIKCSSPVEIPKAGRVIGHEAVGKVTQVGDQTAGVAVGDIVCLESIATCRRCSPCRRGSFNQCDESRLIGLQQDGMFTEYFDTPAVMSHGVGDLVRSAEDLEALACVEPAAVAHLACLNGGVSPGETVLIQGGGPIGFYAALMARTFFGAAQVVVSEPSEARREVARQAADRVVSPEELDTADFRCDVLIEAAGALAGVNRLVSRLNANGRIVLLARTGQPLHLEHVDHLISRSLRIVGSRGHLGGSFGTVLEMIRRGRIDLRLPVTRVVHGLDALAAVLADPAKLVLSDCKVLAHLSEP